MRIVRINRAGGMAACFLVLLALAAIPMIFLLGAAQFSVWALEWIPGLIGSAIILSAVLLPLALVPGARELAGRLYGVASLVFGACGWLYAMGFTYEAWGMLGVVIGILIFGVGVVLTGALAAMLAGAWMVLGNLAFLLGLALMARFLSVWLLQSAAKRRLQEIIRDNPSAATIIQPPGD